MCATPLEVDFQPFEPAFPAGANLAERQPGTLRNFFQGKTAEVVHVDNAGSVGINFFQAFHENADFDDLSGVGFLAAERGGLSERKRRFQATAPLCDPAARQIHRHAPHRQACDRVKVAPIIDLPTCSRDISQPDLLNQFGG